MTSNTKTKFVARFTVVIPGDTDARKFVHWFDDEFETNTDTYMTLEAFEAAVKYLRENHEIIERMWFDHWDVDV